MAEKPMTQPERDAQLIASQDIAKVALKVENNFLLDRWEACAYLGVSKRHLEDQTLKGEIVAVKQGRRVFYSGHVLRSYVNQLITA